MAPVHQDPWTLQQFASTLFLKLPLNVFVFSKNIFPHQASLLTGSAQPTHPVTRIPLSSAFLQTSSKAIWIGVTLMLVRLIEICAIPYSSIYHPIAFTYFKLPGCAFSLNLSHLLLILNLNLPSCFTNIKCNGIGTSG